VRARLVDWPPATISTRYSVRIGAHDAASPETAIDSHASASRLTDATAAGMEPTRAVTVARAFKVAIVPE
jgi:hypothetical protein